MKASILIMAICGMICCICAPCAEAWEVVFKNNTVLAGHIAGWSESGEEFYYIPNDAVKRPFWIPLSDIKDIRLSPAIPQMPQFADSPGKKEQRTWGVP